MVIDKQAYNVNITYAIRPAPFDRPPEHATLEYRQLCCKRATTVPTTHLISDVMLDVVMN